MISQFEQIITSTILEHMYMNYVAITIFKTEKYVVLMQVSTIPQLLKYLNSYAHYKTVESPMDIFDMDTNGGIDI